MSNDSKKDLKIAILKNKNLRNREFQYATGFNFLKEQYGLKLGTVATILGTTGSGKSTFIRSLIRDYLHENNGESVDLFLSEESILSYEAALINDIPDGGFIGRIKIESENDTPQDLHKEKLIELFNSPAKLLIFDNITTSSLYNSVRVSDQGKFLSGIKRLAAAKGKAVVLVAHTDGTVNSRNAGLISSTNVRGNKTLGNISEYFYILHQIIVSEKKYNIVEIEKCRSVSVNRTLFMLKYNSLKNIYTGDNPIDFSTFKDLFKERDKF